MTKRLPTSRLPPPDWLIAFDGEAVSFQGQTSSPAEIDKVIRALQVQRRLLASGIETEGQDAEERLGAKHESPSEGTPETHPAPVRSADE